MKKITNVNELRHIQLDMMQYIHDSTLKSGLTLN